MVSTLNSRCQLGFQILGDACPHFLVLLLGMVVYYETRGRIVTIEFLEASSIFDNPFSVARRSFLIDTEIGPSMTHRFTSRPG